jgi:putative PIN family toxin of toxin-antitoxin system
VKFVLDTDVVIAALRSPAGASAALLRTARRRDIDILASVALALEYEEVLLRPEHGIAAGLSVEMVLAFVDDLIALCRPVDVNVMWRPQLRDADDEMVLEAAINGQADALVTFNRRDYGASPQRFGIELLSPGDALRKVRK